MKIYVNATNFIGSSCEEMLNQYVFIFFNKCVFTLLMCREECTAYAGKLLGILKRFFSKVTDFSLQL